MSLDVYLTLESTKSGIFAREDRWIKEISWSEWNEKFPDRKPFIVKCDECDEIEVYSANITNNLNEMATKIGIYKHLWRPDEIDINSAKELIDPLQEGLKTLRDNPGRFKMFNSSNRQDNYDILVRFVEDYLVACEQYPDARVSVWRG